MTDKIQLRLRKSSFRLSPRKDSLEGNMQLLILASVLTVGLCMPGGYTSQDLTDPAVMKTYMDQLADLQTKGLIFTSMNSLPTLTLLEVQTQVVSGMNYKFKIQVGDNVCTILYYEQSWTNTHNITSDTCTSQKRRQAGGFSVQDATDPKWQEMLTKLSTKTLITLPTNENSYDIVGVKQQVVAGMNYEFTLRVHGQNCTIMYYEVSWENKHEITSDTCSALVHSTRQLAGGWGPVTDTSVEGVQKCLGASLDVINGQQNSAYRFVDTSIQSIEQQVVAGIKYRFTVQVGVSTCSNSGDKMGLTSVHCPVNTNSQTQKQYWTGTCVYTAWQDPKTQVLNVEMGTIDVAINNADSNSLSQKLLGGDTHDSVNHGNNLLGGKIQDVLKLGKNLLGKDGHDLMKHGRELLGGDTHDLQKHVNNLLGKDGHDLMKLGKELLGGDTHDLQKHGKQLIGGDNHDLVQHIARHLIGQDGHDRQSHGNKATDGQECSTAMFEDFQKNHNKLYRSKQVEAKRYKIFCDNMRMARKLQEVEQGTARYGPTKFADLTEAEFKQYVGKKWDIGAMKSMKRADIPKGSTPESFDWRDHGAVTAVKNQGSCGSCWAFSTTGNIEGQWAIKKKKLISLSEQELVDCDKLDEGCNGGLPSNAYKEIERLGGLETEAEYSYKGENEKCDFIKRDVKVYINNSVSISSNETEMASWLAANGPISIGINAFAMQFYMGGISYPWKLFCNPSSLDHGVLIVGYGVQGSKPYWIVKNSWGPDWGEKGYYLVYRGAGVCGLNTMCTSSVVN